MRKGKIRQDGRHCDQNQAGRSFHYEAHELRRSKGRDTSEREGSKERLSSSGDKQRGHKPQAMCPLDEQRQMARRLRRKSIAFKTIVLHAKAIPS